MATTIDEIALLARNMVTAQQDVDAAEEELKKRKELLRRISEETIPYKMEELGLEKLVLATGEVLSVKPEVYCTIPKEGDERRRALQYLIDRNAGDLIKTLVTVEFGKGELKKALRLKRAIEKVGYECSIDQGVHPQTLKAYVREVLEAATPDFNLAIFNGKAVMVAKLKHK